MIRKRSSSAIADIIAMNPPHRGGEVDIAAVEHLDRGSGVDHRFDDLQTVPHRARGAIPFGNHKLVAGVEVIEGAGELRASGHASVGCRVWIGATEAL
jgi:hypothetical protein